MTTRRQSLQISTFSDTMLDKFFSDRQKGGQCLGAECYFRITIWGPREFFLRSLMLFICIVLYDFIFNIMLALVLCKEDDK
jgi:hypothetical protein